MCLSVYCKFYSVFKFYFQVLKIQLDFTLRVFKLNEILLSDKPLLSVDYLPFPKVATGKVKRSLI